jgi:hypothetical protein
VGSARHFNLREDRAAGHSASQAVVIRAANSVLMVRSGWPVVNGRRNERTPCARMLATSSAGRGSRSGASVCV